MIASIEIILEKYFFSYIDQGCLQSQTPLFLGIFRGAPLRNAIAADLPQLEQSEIDRLILCARAEVAL